MWAMSENEWHGTRTWQHEPSTFLKRETTGSLSSEYYKLYSVANVDDSTRFDSNRTTRHSKWQSVIPDANYIQYDGSSFAVTSRSNQVESCRFDNIDNPPFTDTCGIFSKSLTNWLPVCVSKCLANRHPVWRVVRFESIRQHLQPPIADTCGIFSKSLTNWLPVCVSMFWEMVSQNSGITTPLSRESISGLTIRSGLGVLDNPPQLLNDLEIFILLLWICSFCLCQSLKL